MNITLGTSYSFKRIGKRANQEDARYPDEDCSAGNAFFFLVCDGVGGCEKGEVASNTMCRAFAEALKGRDWGEDFSNDDFSRVLDYAYRELNRIADADYRDMGTTLTFVCFHAGGCLAAHIGDSRIYHIRPGVGILYRSEDHSLVNALVRSGNITPEEAVNHPRGNVITRCVSVAGKEEDWAKATVMRIDDLEAGDYFFLCTDGVLESVTDKTLVEVLSSSLPDEAKLNCLADLCQTSHDNHTAYLIPVTSVTKDAVEEVDEPIDVADGGGCSTCAFNRNKEQVREVAAFKPTKPMGKVAAFIQRIFN